MTRRKLSNDGSEWRISLVSWVQGFDDQISFWMQVLVLWPGAGWGRRADKFRECSSTGQLRLSFTQSLLAHRGTPNRVFSALKVLTAKKSTIFSDHRVMMCDDSSLLMSRASQTRQFFSLPNCRANARAKAKVPKVLRRVLSTHPSTRRNRLGIGCIGYKGLSGSQWISVA